MTENMAVEIKQVSKLSMKTIGAQGKLAAGKAEGEFVRLAYIVGLGNGIKFVEDKERGNTYEAATGTFEATNLISGEVFASGVLYLPAGFQDALCGAIRGLQNDKDAVKFAVEMRAVPSENKAGYSYQAVNLLALETTDPLASLRASVQAAIEQKTIQAPVTQAALPASSAAPAAQTTAPAKATAKR